MDSEPSSWSSWVLAGVASVIATLSSAVAYLFRGQVKIYEERIGHLEGDVCKLGEASEKCQEEHTLTKIELARMGERVAMLEKVNK